MVFEKELDRLRITNPRLMDGRCNAALFSRRKSTDVLDVGGFNKGPVGALACYYVAGPILPLSPRPDHCQTAGAGDPRDGTVQQRLLKEMASLRRLAELQGITMNTTSMQYFARMTTLPTMMTGRYVCGRVGAPLEDRDESDEDNETAPRGQDLAS
jgi:hypothetical protein